MELTKAQRHVRSTFGQRGRDWCGQDFGNEEETLERYTGCIVKMMVTGCEDEEEEEESTLKALGHVF